MFNGTALYKIAKSISEEGIRSKAIGYLTQYFISKVISSLDLI